MNIIFYIFIIDFLNIIKFGLKVRFVQDFKIYEKFLLIQFVKRKQILFSIYNDVLFLVFLECKYFCEKVKNNILLYILSNICFFLVNYINRSFLCILGFYVSLVFELSLMVFEKFIMNIQRIVFVFYFCIYRGKMLLNKNNR